MSENKNITFAIRLSEAEHAEIKAAAKRSGRSMSRFFVVAALEKSKMIPKFIEKGAIAQKSGRVGRVVSFSGIGFNYVNVRWNDTAKVSCEYVPDLFFSTPADAGQNREG